MKYAKENCENSSAFSNAKENRSQENQPHFGEGCISAQHRALVATIALGSIRPESALNIFQNGPPHAGTTGAANAQHPSLSLYKGLLA
jgi:hypothetical protein